MKNLYFLFVMLVTSLFMTTGTIAQCEGNIEEVSYAGSIEEKILNCQDKIKEIRENL